MPKGTNISCFIFLERIRFGVRNIGMKSPSSKRIHVRFFYPAARAILLWLASGLQGETGRLNYNR